MIAHIGGVPVEEILARYLRDGELPPDRGGIDATCPPLPDPQPTDG